ncbi:MAG: hypothetical protein ABJQ69_03450 [Ekhidna sp.]
MERFDKELDEIKKLRLENPSQALEMIDTLLRSTDLSNDKKGSIYLQKGLALRSTFSKKDQALFEFYKSLKYFRKTGNIEGQHKALRLLGHTYNDLYHHDYALEYYSEILSLDLDDMKSILYARYNIARTLRLNKQFDSAIYLQKNLLIEFKNENLMIDLIDSHLEIGVSYIGLENWTEAQKHYEAVDNLLNNFEGEKRRYIAKVWGSLGFISMEQGDYIKAENYFSDATPLMIEANDLGMLTINYNDLALLELKKGNQDSAVHFFEKNMELDINSTGVEELINALNELIELSRKKGDSKKALAYSQRLIEITIPFIEQSKKLEKLHNLYKAETAHHAIENFELQESLLRAENRNTVIGIILVFISVVAMVIFFRFKKRQTVDDSLIEALKEKYRLLNYISQKYDLDLESMSKQLKSK